MRRKLMLAVAAGLVLLSMFIFYVYEMNGRVTVVLRNVGDDALRSVVVHVTGNAYPIGDIPAAAMRTLKVTSKGESHIEIGQSGKKRLIVDTYFEESYRGEILVDLDSSRIVHVQDKLRVEP